MPHAFEMLGLPPRYDVAPDAVRRAFLSRIAAAHPDGSPSDESDQQAAAALNAARAVLLNPERRADELLRILGGPTKESDRSLPDGFLADMMETQEAIETATAPAEVARWRAWALEQRQQHSARVSGLFAHAGEVAATERPGVLAHIRKELNAWRYIERLLERLADASPQGEAPAW